MATQVVNGVTFTLPDEIAFAFDLCKVEAVPETGSISRMSISVYNDDTQALIGKANYQPLNNIAQADIRAFLQGAFNRYSLSEVNYLYTQAAPTGKTLSLSVDVYLVDVVTPVTASVTFLAVWGSLNGGELEESYKLYKFGSLPFCATALDYDQITNNVSGQDILSFYSTIEVEELPLPSKYVYLRWVNSRGSYIHYAFCKGDKTMKVDNGSEKIVGNDWNDTATYKDGMRYNTKGVTPSVKCYASALDDADFELLRGVAMSPVVDWYNNGVWEAVNISAKSFTKTKNLAEIEITVEQQMLTIQSL